MTWLIIAAKRLARDARYLLIGAALLLALILLNGCAAVRPDVARQALAACEEALFGSSWSTPILPPPVLPSEKLPPQ